MNFLPHHKDKLTRVTSSCTWSRRWWFSEMSIINQDTDGTDEPIANFCCRLKENHYQNDAHKI